MGGNSLLVDSSKQRKSPSFSPRRVTERVVAHVGRADSCGCFGVGVYDPWEGGPALAAGCGHFWGSQPVYPRCPWLPRCGGHPGSCFWKQARCAGAACGPAGPLGPAWGAAPLLPVLSPTLGPGGPLSAHLPFHSAGCGLGDQSRVTPAVSLGPHVQVLVYTLTHTCRHSRTCSHMQTQRCTCAYTRAGTHVRGHTCAGTHMYMCTHMQALVCTHMQALAHTRDPLAPLWVLLAACAGSAATSPRLTGCPGAGRRAPEAEWGGVGRSAGSLGRRALTAPIVI